MKYFVSSDYHLGHSAILRYANRPFASVEEMNYKIIQRVNERVKSEDHLFLLGDNFFRNSVGGDKDSGLPIKWPEYRKQILCQNITYIAGNHCVRNGGFRLIQNLVIYYSGLYMCMVHDPALHPDPTEYNPMDLWLHGHTHSNKKHIWVGQNNDRLMINCCVEAWNYYPIELGEIVKYRNKVVKEHA